MVGWPVGQSGQQVGPSIPLVMISVGCWSIAHLFAGSFPPEVFWGQASLSVVEQSVVGLVVSLVMRCLVVCHDVGWLVGWSVSQLWSGCSVVGWSVGRTTTRDKDKANNNEDKQLISQLVNRRQQSTFGDCVGDRMRRE